ncbi:hypothetical protein [Glycomyces buryatensis]|uniref:DUF2690 domain-containing protein n=1 Tax=Glycomyces buryatensis TaxID=2570927 RepID=A0A4S8QIE8_9ACTN|nr:hypothetical protein [Glycomyces buryatensis]THV42765.1 hypothetical protein FAB82_04385 [Glycomyces buryatensis]
MATIIRRLTVLAATMTLALGLSLAAAAPAQAVSPMCSDAYQVKSTVYIYGGQATPVASLKQYYSPSCRQNWGYLWIWQWARDAGYWIKADLAIFVQNEGLQGLEGVGTYDQEALTRAVPGYGKCTRAYIEGTVYKWETQLDRFEKLTAWGC